MKLEGLSIIGAARGAAEGIRFRAVNASTGEPLEPEFFAASLAEVERAAGAAAAAAAACRDVANGARGAFLRAVATKLEECGGDLIARAHLETALPTARLQGELGRTCGQLRLFASLVEEGSWVDARIDLADRDRKPVPRPDLRSMLRPLGPVVVFGASNFPLAFSVAGGDTASALAAGCPVIVKAHPAHPGTSELAALAVRDAALGTNMPEGVFSMLFDAEHAVGLALVAHPLVKAVAFTGSRRGGEALMEAVRKRREPIPLYAEMGSVNPVFVLRGALRERRDAIAAGLHAAVTVGVGQFCTNPGVIVVERGPESEALLRDLEARIGTTAEGTMLTAGICEAFQAGVARLEQTAGVVRRAAGKAGGGRAAAALFTTDARTFASEELVRGEVFGPSTIVVECDSGSEMIDVARALEGQLSATVHALPADLHEHRELIALLEEKAGRIVFDGYPTGLEVAHATVHGGPYPATSDGRSTSVGTRAIERFVRPVCWQDAPDELLPPELREANPLGIRRLVDGVLR